MLTSTTSTMFRPGLSAVNRGSLPQPVTGLFRRASTCPFHGPAGQKPAVSLAAQRWSLSSSYQPSHNCVRRKPAPIPSNYPPSRQISSAAVLLMPAAPLSPAEQDAAAAAATAAVSKRKQAANPDLPLLDWNTFFDLRKTRRRIQVAFSFVGSLTGALTGGLLLSTGIAEPAMAMVPGDPIFALGLMTFGFTALGWLFGPSIGNMVFYAWKRPYKVQMTAKEAEFFARIKKNRVDPSASSAGNPVPDFYGEKISSVAGYRQWLKDQRAFNKKRTTFV